jgi:hypothetical protein
VRGAAKSDILIPLVPKLHLGTKIVAKLSLAGKGVPKIIM